MSNFCPEWIFGCSSAYCAHGFLSSENSLNAIARKFSIGLNQNYTEIKFEELSDTAEQMLQFLSEINVGEEAVDYLNHYIFKRIHFQNNGSERKLSGMFASPLNPEKLIDYGVKKSLKVFRATIFGIRNNVMEKSPPGWSISDVDEGIKWFKDLVEKPVDLLDNF